MKVYKQLERLETSDAKNPLNVINERGVTTKNIAVNENYGDTHSLRRKEKDDRMNINELYSFNYGSGPSHRREFSSSPLR